MIVGKAIYGNDELLPMPYFFYVWLTDADTFAVDLQHDTLPGDFQKINDPNITVTKFSRWDDEWTNCSMVTRCQRSSSYSY